MLDLDPLLRARRRSTRETALFGEGPGGIVVSGPRETLMELSKDAAGVGFLALGSVGGETIRITAALLRSTYRSRRQGVLFHSGLADQCRD